MDPPYNFGPACYGEKIVFGSERPGMWDSDTDAVPEWIAFMRGQRIRRVCSLFTKISRLTYETDPLIAYRDSFGADRVLYCETEDFTVMPRERLLRACNKTGATTA